MSFYITTQAAIAIVKVVSVCEDDSGFSICEIQEIIGNFNYKKGNQYKFSNQFILNDPEQLLRNYSNNNFSTSYQHVADNIKICQKWLDETYRGFKAVQNLNLV